MSEKLLRVACTAAVLVLAGALPVAAEPVPDEPGTSASLPDEPVPGEPGPGEPGRTESGPGASAPAGGSLPDRPAVAELLSRLRTLYREAEEASEAYNAAEEALKAHTAETKRLTGDLTRVRGDLARSRADAGRLARAQYQGRTELSSALRLLLGRDPHHALDQARLVRRAAREQASAVARLERGERRADALATQSRRALDREQTLTELRRAARDEAQTRLKEVEETLASMSEEEAAEVSALEESQTADAQRELLAGGGLDGAWTPSEEGDEALEYAAEQIGKPYEWGAEGPESFDCSGLTSRAWARAGRTIPRTSQEQWRTLPKVPLRALRPGDLVVYFPGATHVAIYLGDGLVIQAPRPGARVKVSPLAANPLLGAVRPDPEARPLRTYTPPRLAPAASAGPDTGYDAP
ncbi:NlpC/P60 family protein [Streptomyces sp. NPDC013953]|uniref:C40 family peptidase n=1 Tax=Streptomyces sp. NPDC013953 TaxID=3364868 RepID=UPI0036F8BA6B